MGKGKTRSQPDGSTARASGPLMPGGRHKLLKDVEFSLSKNCNVAMYERNKLALARFVGVQGWTGANVAGLALELGVELIIVKPMKPNAPRNKYKKR